MRSPDRVDLALRIRNSDPDAFREAYELLNRPLVRYVQQIVRDIDTAYDVLQETFTKLWEMRARLAHDSNLKALLYTMARNRALNHVRTFRRRSSIPLDQLGESPASGSSADASSDLEARELHELLSTWISALPPRRAEAFVLSRFHGLRHSEIADIMQLSERTVETHVLHALRDLRAHLAATPDR